MQTIQACGSHWCVNSLFQLYILIQLMVTACTFNHTCTQTSMNLNVCQELKDQWNEDCSQFEYVHKMIKTTA